MPSTDSVDRLLKAISATELLRICSMEEAARLSGLSPDTLRRHHADKVRKLSPRRNGVRLVDALLLRESETT
jgi:hypothetical protein